MTKHAEPDDAGKPNRTQIEEIHPLRSRLTRLEQSEVRHGQTKDVYQSLIASLPQGLLIVQDGRIVLANEAMADLTGYSIDEMKSATLQQVQTFVHPEDRELVWGRYRDRLAGKPLPKHYEFRGIRKDGNTCWLEAYVRSIEYGGERVVQAAFTDITEPKRMEAAFRDSDRKLEEAQRIAHIGHWEHDLDADAITGSDETLRIFGVAPQERTLSLTRFLELVHPEDRERVARTSVEAIRDREAFDLEYRVVRPAGEVRFVHVLCQVTREESGRPRRLFGTVQDITERRQAAAALQRSEQKYHTIVDTTSEGIWVFGPDAMTTFVNARMAQMLGYAGEEMIGRPMPDFMFGEDVPDHQRKMQNRRQGMSENYERRFRRKDGRTVWTVVSATPVFDDEHRFQGSFGMFTDITDRTRAEKALRESEARFRDLYENAPNAYFSVGSDGLVRRCNRRAGELLGYPVEELVGRPVIQLYGEGVHGKEKAKRVLRRFQSGDVVRDEELEMQKADGNRVWISLTVDAIRDAQGQIQESRSMVVDITERKRAENIRNARLHLLQFAAAHSLDELLQATLDDLEVLTDSQIGFYHFLEADQQTLSLHAWSTRTLRELCKAEGKGRHYSVSEAGVWVDCIRERRPVIHNDYASLPHRRGMPPGHAPVVRELVVPVFRGDRIVAILGVGNKPKDYSEGDVEIVSNLADLAWDIADRKRAEQQAQERQAELLHVSRLNTLGEMASGLAHELSQPLSAILNYASAGVRRSASGQSDMDGIVRSLEKIAGQAKRAGDILSRIRALAQRRPPQLVSVDVNEIVGGVMDFISWEARHREVAVELELGESLPAVCVDRVEIEQVVLNLARNAIEAMGDVERRPRRLTVRTHAEEGRQVRIEVRDTGVGLPQDKIGRIFEPFFTTKTHGLGVGLSISRTIVEMHNGTLEARPNVDCGSTFVLALPAALPETP